MSHINRFSGTEWCFRWVLFRENVLGGTKWNVGCDVWRGDRLRVVGVEVGDNNERRERRRESDAVL